MNPDQNRLVGENLSLDHRDVYQVIDVVFVNDYLEFTGKGRGNDGFRGPADKGFRPHPVFDKIGNGTDADAMFFAEFFKGGHSGHGAVVIHDFADDARRL